VPLVLASGQRLQLVGETVWVPVASLRRHPSGVPLELGLGAAAVLIAVAGATAMAAGSRGRARLRLFSSRVAR
jgi:hypothetical protein